MKIRRVYAEILLTMAAIPLKKSILLLLGGFVFAAAAAFLANFLLAGPKLGPHYDFLLKWKEPPPVSNEILIIETNGLMEGKDIYSVLMTLTEMGAASLIVAGDVSSSSSPVTGSEAEIRRRFIEEYLLLGANIRNLFDAIRLGSLSPVQAPGYVDHLLELTEQGRDRLLRTLVDRDEDMLRSISVFGNYLEAGAVPVLDWDGKLRRVRPVEMESSLEHPVLLCLKNRFIASQIETSDTGSFLWLRRGDGSELDLPLDKDGNIITPWNCSFRRVDFSLFREYEEAENAMRAALTAADKLGAFSQTYPEQSPMFLGDYANVFRDELLESPGVEKRVAWIAARANYFKSLDDFLTGTAEILLVNGYNDVIADEKTLSEEGLAALAGMRDELIMSFAVMREEYVKLSALRSRLTAELAFSLCVMGSSVNAEYSALLANTLITGAHVKPASDRYALFWSIAASFIVLEIIFLLNPAAIITVGLCLSVLASSAFGVLFIFFSQWIDPAIALCSSLTGTLFVFFCKCAIMSREARRFRVAYGAAVSKDTLRYLIRRGKPQVSQVNVSFSAVIAIKDVNLLSKEDREKPQDAGKAKNAFYSSAKKLIFDAGAVIAGFEGDTILACFGSPLDRFRDTADNSVKKACAFVGELLRNNNISWRFGIDAGECSFFWSQECGFSAYGKPAVRARLLASRTMRFKVRAVIANTVLEKTSFNGEKIGTLYDKSETFFVFS
jgi:hypothetical protein